MSYHSSEHSSSAASSSSSSLNSNEDEGINVELLLIYVRKVLKKWWVILVVALVLAAVGFSVARITYVPYYSSQIEFVATNKDISMASSGQTLSDMNAAVSLAENYKYVLTTTELATRVAENCGYKNITADDIKHFVSVESVEDTAIIFLTVTTTDKEVSYAIANTYMEFYQEAITSAFPSTMLNQIDPPRLAEHPNADNSTLMYTVIGFAAGLLLSTLFLIMQILLKDTVLSSDDIKNKLDMRIVGTVNHVHTKGKKGEKHSILLTDRRSGFAFIEAFKLIRTKIDHTLRRKGKKALVVTSTAENEGKTTTAINIALALAKNDKEVLLIDGDLRKPAVAKSLGVTANDNSTVLSVINGSCDLADAIKYSEKYNLYLLLNSKSIPDSSELLATSQMQEIIEKAKQEFDYVVIDTAPCGVVADASILAGFSDAIVMVVRQDTVPMRRIKRAMEDLDNSGTEVIGCIYNDAKSAAALHVGRHRYGYGYGYGYGGYGYGYGYGYGEQSKDSKK